MIHISHRAIRFVASGVLLGIVCVAGPLLPRSAFALLSTCRSDPVVVLSNGATIDLQAGIQDSQSDVQGVVYAVHVPKGTRALSVVNTDGLIGLVERVVVYSDSPAGTYTSDTSVSTGANNVGVTATTTVISSLGLTLGIKSVSGLSGQSLSIQITPLL